MTDNNVVGTDHLSEFLLALGEHLTPTVRELLCEV